ncbi:MAG TPA: hypothetical protein VFD72_02050 [Sphingobacteriaceae bacterium]|nr:hypothetical protein [Sphingobacteriaceae bacterium]
MKSKLSLVSVVGIVFLITLFFSCGKDAGMEIGPEKEIQRKVSLRLSAFDSQIKPIQYIQSEGSSSWNHLFSEANDDQNVFASPEMQYLYLWSFNDESIRPDLGIDRANAGIRVLRTNGPDEYAFLKQGYAFLEYPGGNILNIAGPEKVTFQMPIDEVEKLGMLRFDMSGSPTGPKDFSIYYQLDAEEEILISDENQFSSLNGKNTYEYDLTGLNLDQQPEQLNIIIVPMEGQRPEGTNYNQSSGTIRIDNFALQGIYTGGLIEPEKPKMGTLDYFIFDQVSGDLLVSEQKQLNFEDTEHTIEFQIGDGTYYMLVLVSSRSNTLNFPDNPLPAEQFYVLTGSTSQEDVVFGKTLSHFEVKEDLELDLLLERFYSEVVYELNDPQLGSLVKRIEVESVQSIYYSPFNLDYSPPLVVEQMKPVSVFYPESFEQGTIVFNQFLGFRENPLELSYKLSAYDHEDELLNEIITTAEITHNMRLIFSGFLLGSNASSSQVFRIDRDSPWQESVRVDF